MSGMAWPSKQEKERESVEEKRERERDAKNWCGWKLSHYSWQKSRCCCCRVSNLARKYHRVTLHSLQTDCPIAPTTPPPLAVPSSSLHHLHLPFRVLGVKSVIGSRASPATRQQAGHKARILWQPTTATLAPYALPSSASPFFSLSASLTHQL